MSIEWINEVGSKAVSRTVHLDLARRASAQYPGSAPAWYALAEGHYQAEDFADVAAASERAMALAAPSALQLLTYAKALLALDRAAAALEALDQHTPAPSGSSLRAVRGEAYRRLGRLAEARVEFDAALAAEPGEVTAGQGLVRLLSEQGAWRELLDAIDGVAARGAPSVALQLARWRALMKLDQDAGAWALVDFDRVGRVTTIATPRGFANLAGFNTALVAELMSPLHSTLSDRPRLRLMGGKQIEDLENSKGPALLALFDVIRAAVEAYFQTAPGAPRRAELLPWALVLGPEDYQDRHYHVEAALAGVYYVAAPAEILDEGEVGGALVIPDVAGEFEGGERLVRHIQPLPGRLVLFPGHLPHRTLPTGRPGQRISIAFNVVSRDEPA